MDVHSRIADNRRLAADFFDRLDDEQLAVQSLCSAWTVREVLGHLVASMTGGLGGLLLHVVRAGGSVNRANASMAREAARRPVGELTAILRERADEHGAAPGVGAIGPLADSCLHLRDCARPLELPDSADLEDWRTLLDRLPSGVPGLVPRRRLAGLDLRADDQDWRWGSGAEVVGPSEALVMAAAGRRVALDDLAGPGVQILRRRIDGDR